MTWAKLDDRMHDDPRTERAGLEAMGLWAIALSYMGDYATNGVISKERIRKFAGRSGHWLAERLVKAGWWVRSDGGYTLVDWELYLIPNVGTNLGRRSAEPRAKVGRTSGESTHEPPPVRGDVHETDGPRESRGETPRAGARPDPDPTRPDPERSEDQTPLPPKGAQVSILGMADGSGEAEAPKGKAKRKPPAPVPDVPRAALQPLELAALEAIEAHPMLLALCKDPCRLARGLCQVGTRIDVVAKIHALAMHAEHKGTYKNGNSFLGGCIARDQADATARGARIVSAPAMPTTPPRCPPRPKAVEDGIRQIVAEREAAGARGEVDTLADSRRRAEAAGALVGFGGMEPAEHESEMFS